MTFTAQELYLLVSSLRVHAVQEANLHYAGDDTCGIAGELNALADKIELSDAAEGLV
jgi:hypothetical protein